jgi:predicted acylesterase/phospholipase RssA
MATATSSQEAVADAADTPEAQQIRLCLVMNGGVSLAVWMGGVTTEINRVIGRDGVYGEILDFMNSDVRVDVITGASAGGINGAVLAAMISHENDREAGAHKLRRLWIDDGGFGVLFRRPLQKNPPSILKGDEFFLPALRDGFEGLTAGRTTDPDGSPVRLTLTTTLLKAVNRGFADDFGSLVVDADHRGEFTFRRGEELDDDFADPEIAKRLALASRCTASFPGAFEPSFVPIGTTADQGGGDPDRPDMKGFANFSSSRFCVDGGALVNKPFRPAIRGIFAQPASTEHVRRVLAYIVPDPGGWDRDEPQRGDEVQTIAQVGLAAGVTVPRTESVSRELEDIAEHNKRVRAQQLFRDNLLAPEQAGPADIEAMAERLFPAFQTVRAQRIVDRLTTAADPFEGRFDGLGSAPWDTDALTRLLTEDPMPWLPSSLGDGTSLTQVPWTWGNDTIEAMGAFALGIVGIGLRAADPGTRTELVKSREALHALLRELRLSCLRPEPDYWTKQSLLTQEYWKSRPAMDTAAWQRESFEEWRETSDDWGPRTAGSPQPAAIARGIASALVAAAPHLVEASSGGSGTPPGSNLATLVGALVPDSTVNATSSALRRLLAQAIVQSVTSAARPELDQLVELLQISSTAPNGFDDRVAPDKKVAGRQLGHFGGFYKKSWRANDWMWGRLDGATRLAQMIADPKRLAQLGVSPAMAFDRLKEIALGTEDEARSVLSDGSPHGWDDERARRELSFLDQHPPAPPTTLPICAMAIARRIQLGILQEELPFVADAIRADIADGASQRAPAVGFMRAVRDAQHADPRDGTTIGPKPAAELLPRCRVGEEKIEDEVGSDLFTTTVTTAAAVGVAAAAGTTSGLPAFGRAVVGGLRTPTLGLWFMAKSAVSSQRTTFAFFLLLLAVGGSLIAVSAVGNVPLPGFLAALGTLILLCGVALVLVRLKTGGYLVILLSVAVVVLLLWVPSVVVKQVIDPDATGVASWIRQVVPPAAAVIGFVLGGMLLGLVYVKPPKDERDLPGRAGRRG